MYRIINCIPVGGIKLITHFKQNLMKVNYATVSHNSPKSMFQFVDNNDRTVALIGKELHSILFAQHVFPDSSTICSKVYPECRLLIVPCYMVLILLQKYEKCGRYRLYLPIELFIVLFFSVDISHNKHHLRVLAVASMG